MLPCFCIFLVLLSAVHLALKLTWKLNKNLKIAGEEIKNIVLTSKVILGNRSVPVCFLIQIVSKNVEPER